MSETTRRPVGRPVTTGTTPKRGIRVPDDEWTEITAKAKAQGADATSLTRAFYAWWLRKPGAKLPARPDQDS
jgi:hypothetical protein